jgi:hypothetical protein
MHLADVVFALMLVGAVGSLISGAAALSPVEAFELAVLISVWLVIRML